MRGHRNFGTIGLISLLILGVGCGGGDHRAEPSTAKPPGVDQTVDGSGGSGGGGEASTTDLPKGWPDDLKPPKAANVTVAEASGDTLYVVYDIDEASIETVTKQVTTQLEKAGYEVDDPTSPTPAYAYVSARKPPIEVTTTINAAPANGSGTRVQMTVLPNGH